MSDIETLYNKYSKEIYKHLLWLTHDETLSEDLLQETFFNAIIGIKKFRGESSVKTWLYSIARHLWLRNLRKSNDNIPLEDAISTVIVDRDIGNDVADNNLINRIYELLNLKDEKISLIVKMRFNGYSYSEISSKVGISESSARVIDFRCKKWIKETLEKEELI